MEDERPSIIGKKNEETDQEQERIIAQSDDGDDTGTGLITCCGRKLYGGNRDAFAFQLDNISKAFAYATQVAFTATAVLKLANEIAQCDEDDEQTKMGEEGANENLLEVECEGKILGLRPSSLLTLYSTITAFVAALIIPFVGSIVDHSPYRLRVGRIIAIIYLASLFPSLFTSRQIWGLLAACTTMIAVLIEWSNGIAYAYLPEMSSVVEKSVYNGWVTSFVAGQSGTMVLFILANVVASKLFGYDENDLVLARVSSAANLVLAIPLTGLAWWRYFGHRGPLRELPPNSSLLTAGFIQVYNTSKRIARDYNALKWFYIQAAFGDGFVISFATLAITVSTETLGFTGQQNGIAALSILAFSCLGAFVARCYNQCRNPIESSMVACAYTGFVSIGMGFVFANPTLPSVLFYLSASFVGLGFGWKRCSDEYMAALLIPKGQDAELMGFYTFVRICLTWLPPLLFTAFNEAGVPQSYIIMMIAIVMYSIAFVSLWKMGNFESALARVNEGSERAQRGGHDEVEQIQNTVAYYSSSDEQEDEIIISSTSNELTSKDVEASTMPVNQ